MATDSSNKMKTAPKRTESGEMPSAVSPYVRERIRELAAEFGWDEAKIEEMVAAASR